MYVRPQRVLYNFLRQCSGAQVSTSVHAQHNACEVSYQSETSRNKLCVVMYRAFRLFRLAVKLVGTGGSAILRVNSMRNITHVKFPTNLKRAGTRYASLFTGRSDFTGSWDPARFNFEKGIDRAGKRQSERKSNASGCAASGF